MSEALKNDFIKYLNEEDFEAAESLIASDIFDVEDQMDELSEEDLKHIEPHWSAVNTGESISTPFFVLKEISDFMKFQNDTLLIDIGSGHGGPGLVFGALNPSMKVLGYEIVLEKVNGALKSAKRLSIDNAQYFCEDLETFSLPIADYYYSFNPVNKEIADSIASKLCGYSRSKKIQIICSDEGMDNKAFKDHGFKLVKAISKWGIEVLEA